MNVVDALNQIEKLILDGKPPAYSKGLIHALQDQLEAMQKHSDTLSALEKEHADFKRKCAETTAELKAQHAQAIASLKADHAKEISELNSAQAKAIARLNEQHGREKGVYEARLRSYAFGHVRRLR